MLAASMAVFQTARTGPNPVLRSKFMCGTVEDFTKFMKRFFYHPGSYVATRIEDNGDVTEKKFTSQAQARQFVEEENRKLDEQQAKK